MRHDEIQVEQAHTFTWKLYEDAIQIVPTSATVTIKRSGGTTVQTGSGTIDSEGTITFTLTAANNTTIAINYRALLAYTYSGDDFEQARLFDVVKVPVVNLTTDKDLYTYLPALRRDLFTYQGDADVNGSLTTIIDEALESDDRDFKGGKVEIYVSETKVHEANVTSFDKDTGTVTFSPAYTSTINTDVKYVIRESYTEYIDTAFYDHVRPILRKKQGYISGYIDSDTIKNLVTFKAIQLIIFPNIVKGDDQWDIRYKKFTEMFNTALTNFGEPYDYGEDGEISQSEEESKFNFTVRKVTR